MITVNANALGWKFPNQAGIRTREGILIEWPSILGTFPTQIQVDTWAAEYLVAKPDIDAEQGIKGHFERNRIARLIFEIEYDQESRIRVLEGKPAITKIQYRSALKAKLKALP